MLVRKTLAGAVAATLAGSAVLLSAGSASAAEADDPGFTPTATDLIGVGSDTIQHTLHLLAEGDGGWNSQSPSFRLASFAALGGGNITLPSGDIPRPNGSGAGKALLYGAGNNTDIDFARSSSGPSTTEVQAGLQSIPFALDTLVMAVSKSVPSNAPASLTPDQIVSIYKGDITNWSEVGGQPGVIAPKIPQPGSGTRSFFTDRLKAMNGGVAVDFAASVTEVQEHDDTPIKSDPNAIAPFSKGRAGLLGSTLQLEQGWSADRALYDVVRGADLGRADIQALFGEDGFVCSTQARDLIEASGFEQLATPDHGGVCGEPTQSATTNFTTNEQVTTTTVLAATSPKGGKATLKATVTGSTSPSGTVSFLEGETTVASDVPLVGGVATATVAATPGEHTYSAVFTPEEGSVFEPSSAEDTVVVKAGSKVSESFPAKVAKGKKAKGTVTVSATGADATGKVMIKEGSKTLKSASLKGGKATITLPKLAKGKHKLKAVYAGDSTVAGSSKSFTVKQK